MAVNLTEVLQGALDVDSTVRKSAEKSLEKFKKQNLAAFYLSLSAELASEENPIDSRKLAGLVFKNALDAEKLEKEREKGPNWFSLDAAVKSKIKDCLLETLRSPEYDARSTASLVIAKAAGIELPSKQWPELIGRLSSNFSSVLGIDLPPSLLKILHVPWHVKQANLKTLGYLCEEVPDVTHQGLEEEIIFAVFQGMEADEHNVQLASMEALCNILLVWPSFFDKRWDYILKLVFKATDAPELKVRLAAFESLVLIGSVYYAKLSPYIQEIFNITSSAVWKDEPIALQAIEFWSTICEKEIDCTDSGIPCSNFVKQIVPKLVPVLLELLDMQEEGQEGLWNVPMASGTCLALVSQTVGDDIFPLVSEYISQNMDKDSWKNKNAAIHALGCILEGPSRSKVQVVVNLFRGTMINDLAKHQNGHLRYTNGWVLDRIYEFHFSRRGSRHLTPDPTRIGLDAFVIENYF